VKRAFIIAAVVSLVMLYLSVNSWIAGIHYWRDAEALRGIRTIGPSDLNLLATELNRQMVFREIKWAVCLSAATSVGLTLTCYFGMGLRKSRRIVNGLCANCSYDLTGNESGVCPECGAAVIAAKNSTWPAAGT
jgi:hypothetical protein